MVFASAPPNLRATVALTCTSSKHALCMGGYVFGWAVGTSQARELGNEDETIKLATRLADGDLKTKERTPSFAFHMPTPIHHLES